MVTNEEQSIWTTFTVSSVTQVMGRNNRPEYEITGRWEWTPASNTWGDKTYCPRDICPEVINPGSHIVLAKRGELKKDRNGEFYDGSHQWMYRWRITEWEGVATEGVTTAPPAAAPAPAPQPTPEATPHLPVAETQPQHVVDIFAGIDQTQMRIMRQATLKCASWMIVPLVAEYDSNFDDGANRMAKAAEELSELFLEYVVTGKIYEDIPEDAEDLLNEEF